MYRSTGPRRKHRPPLHSVDPAQPVPRPVADLPGLTGALRGRTGAPIILLAVLAFFVIHLLGVTGVLGGRTLTALCLPASFRKTAGARHPTFPRPPVTI